MAGMRKYNWKYERDVREIVEVELYNGEKMEVEAKLRACADDFKAKLRPYDGEWYDILPESVRIEDEQLRHRLLTNTK